MKKLFLIFLTALGVALGAPTTPVNNASLTGAAVVPSGATLTINSGASIVAAAGSTVTGFGTGTGTVTVVGAGSLTSTALVTGGGSQTLQTAAVTATMDSSGNISTPGSLTTGAGGSAAGFVGLGQGTAPSTGTTNIKLAAPASVTSWIALVPGTVGTNGAFWTQTTSGTTATLANSKVVPSGTVVGDTDSQALTNKTYNGMTVTSNSGTFHVGNAKSADITASLTFTGTDGTTMTFPTTSATVARTDAANTFTGASTATGWVFTTPLLGTPTSGTLTNCTGLPAASVVSGALANGMTATTQAAESNDTKLATDAYADAAGRASHLGTFASPNTAAGSITWTTPVYNIYTSAASTRTYTLPAASTYVNKAFILNVAVGTGHVNVQPASGAALVLAGVLLTADHYVQAATSAPGNYICFISDGTNWTSLGSSGTWADAASP